MKTTHDITDEAVTWSRFAWLRGFAAVMTVLTIVLLTIGMGFRSHFLFDAEKRLEAAKVETGHADPDWEWERILAGRKPVAEDENSATVVLAAAKELPPINEWLPLRPAKGAGRDRAPAQPAKPDLEAPVAPLGTGSISEEMSEVPWGERLEEALAGELRTRLEKDKRALDQARRLADMPRGRYDVRWKPDFCSTMLPHVEAIRKIGELLLQDAELAAHDGDFSRALRSTRAILQTARSIGDEPVLVSLLARIGVAQLAINSLIRVLSLGEASEESLHALQQVVEDELAQSLLLPAFRGERAGMLCLFDRLYDGRVRWESVATGNPQPVPWYEDAFDWAYFSPLVRRNQADYLERTNRIIQVLKLPIPEQLQELEQLENEWSLAKRSSPDLKISVSLLGGFFKIPQVYYRSRAQLQTARVALALECARRKQGRWPDSLDQLVPEWLGKVPLDPYTGKPLLYRPWDHGVVVYSVGPNQQDDGGQVVKDVVKSPDLGIRLWNPESRGRGVAPPPIQ